MLRKYFHKKDLPLFGGIYFQDSASPSMEGIEELHDYIMFYLIFVLVVVVYMFFSVIKRYSHKNIQISHKHANHGTLIELFWTITPAFILVAIAIPSFRLIYLIDEVVDPAMTVKAVGRQWFWNYQITDFVNEQNEPIEFDSYVVPEEDLSDGDFRLLEVDNKLVLPIDTHLRFIITASDVIHDFAVPALGLKVDAIPGRLNQASVIIQRPGLFYGQCSEICGVLHSAMPIGIEALPVDQFITWLNHQG